MHKLFSSVFLTLIVATAPAFATSYEGKAGLLNNLLESNFDRRCLTKPDSEAVRRLSVEPDGTLKFEKLPGRREAVSVQDDFYREQSIWELAPVTKYWAGSGFDLACNGTPAASKEGPCPELASRKSDEYVFLHLIPASAGGLILSWESKHQGQIHNPNNVLRLKISKLQDPRLLEFRKEWVKFFLAHPDGLTDIDLEKQANELREKYANFFS